MYFENTQVLENTLLPYFYDEYPLISLNKAFSKLNYEKYNTHLQPHGLWESYDFKTKLIVKYKNGKLNGLSEEWFTNGKLYKNCWYKNSKLNGLYEIWFW